MVQTQVLNLLSRPVKSNLFPQGWVMAVVFWAMIGLVCPLHARAQSPLEPGEIRAQRMMNFSGPTTAIVNIPGNFNLSQVEGVSPLNNTGTIDLYLYSISKLCEISSFRYSYQWQQAISGDWSDIPGATSDIYNAPAGPPSGSFYRLRINTGSCGIVFTNSIFVSSIPTQGTIASAQAVACPSQILSPLTCSVAGGSDDLEYRWQIKYPNGNWQAPGPLTGGIDNQPTLTFTQPLTSTAEFRREVFDRKFGWVNVTAPITITVLNNASGCEEPQITGVSASPADCNGQVITINLSRFNTACSFVNGVCQGGETFDIYVNNTLLHSNVQLQPVYNQTTGQWTTTCQNQATGQPTRCANLSFTATNGLNINQVKVVSKTNNKSSNTYAVSPAITVTQIVFNPGAIKATGKVYRNQNGALTLQTVDVPGNFSIAAVPEMIQQANDEQIILTTSIPPSGTASNIYTYQWQQSADGTNWNNIFGANASSYAVPKNIPAGNQFRLAVSTLGCVPAFTNAIAIPPVLSQGTSSPNQSLGSNQVPAAISAVVSGGSGDFEYLWQWSPVGGNSWATWNAGSNNASSLSFSQPLSSSLQFRRITVDKKFGWVSYSLPTIITRILPVDAGTIEAGGNPIICAGSPTPSLNVNIAPSGGLTAGSYIHHWQDSVAGRGWQFISGATGATYTPPAINRNTWFRRATTCIECGSIVHTGPAPPPICNSNCNLVFTNVVGIQVVELTGFVPGQICGNQSVVVGVPPQPLTMTSAPQGASQVQYQWQEQVNGQWQDLTGATADSYQPSTANAASVRSYRLRFILGACSSFSNPVMVVTSAANLHRTVTARLGRSLTLTAQTTGSVSYRWYRGCEQLASTQRTLTIPIFGEEDAGIYWVHIVQNGVVTSGESILVRFIEGPDLWMMDDELDVGEEPNLQSAWFYGGHDIWVRNERDPAHRFAHKHQNPKYGKVNYVYVKVRNRGNAPGSGQLYVQSTLATTTGFPEPGEDVKLNGMSVTSSLNGNTPIQIENLIDDTIYEIPWLPPTDYQTNSTTKNLHFCLFARLEPTAIDRNTDITTYVRNDNGAIWKNVDMPVDGCSDTMVRKAVIVRNICRDPAPISLSFRHTPPAGDTTPVNQVAKILLVYPPSRGKIDNLPPDSGITPTTTPDSDRLPALQLNFSPTRTTVSLRNLAFAPNELGIFEVRYYFTNDSAVADYRLVLDILQEQPVCGCTTNCPPRQVGGENFTVQPCPCVNTPSLEIPSADTLNCGQELDAAIGLSPNPFVKYVWSTGQEGSKLKVLTSGKYTVTATTANGCSTSKEITVTVTPATIDDRLLRLPLRIMRIPEVISTSAVTYADIWLTNFGQARSPQLPADLVGKLQSTDDYFNGRLGVWRPQASYAYVTERSQTTTLPNLAKDGTFNLKMFDWRLGGDLYCPEWRKVSTTTQYSPDGSPVEEYDILPTFSAALYGYGGQLSTATGANASYGELAYEGFEEYDVAQILNADRLAQGNLDLFTTATPGSVNVRRHVVVYGGNQQYGLVEGNMSFLAGKTVRLKGVRLRPDNPGPLYGLAQINTVSQLPAAPNQNKSLLTFANPQSHAEWRGEISWEGQQVPIVELRGSTVTLARGTAHTGKQSLRVQGGTGPRYQQVRAFVQPGKRYVVGAWVRVPSRDQQPSFASAAGETNRLGLAISFGGVAGPFLEPLGKTVEGWQRLEGTFEMPANATQLFFTLQSGAGNAEVFWDDLRLFPEQGNMQSFVYDPQNQRLTATLDNNNYATLYFYDEQGNLFLLKKETERGIMTIQESNTHPVKTR